MKTLIYRGEGNSSIVFACTKERVVYRLFKTGSYQENHEDEGQLRQKQETIISYIRNVIKPVVEHGLVFEGELLTLTPADLQRMQEIQNIPGLRPKHRLNSIMNSSSGLALKLPDFCFLRNGTTANDEATCFAIEIKPKCGFLTSLSQREPWERTCRFCQKQHLKVKIRQTKSISKFCPIDFFSGHRPRMKHSLKMLFETPQNNLRIFMNGILLFSEEDQSDEFVDKLLQHFFVSKADNLLRSKESVIDALCDILVDILLQSPIPHSNKSNPPSNSTNCDTSIQQRQQSQQSTTQNSTQITQSSTHITQSSTRIPQNSSDVNLSHQTDSNGGTTTQNNAQSSTTANKNVILSSMETEYEKLLSLNLQRCEHSKFPDNLVSRLPPGCVLSHLLERQSFCIGGINAFYPLYKQLVTELDDDLLIRNCDQTLLDGPYEDYAKPCTAFKEPHLNHCVDTLKKYKFSKTMMDSSIMVALQRLEPGAPATSNVIESSIGGRFQTEIRLLDLDPKSVTRMDKWLREDEEVSQLASTFNT